MGSRVERIPDLVFAHPGGHPLHADLYVPGDRATALPVIVWLHGGGWRFGDRRTGPNLSRFSAECGFAMVSVEYRLSRQAQFPSQVEDVKTAIRWIRSVAGTYGFDATRIGLWGASAGGHLAAMAALSDRGQFESDRSEHAGFSSAVQAVVAAYAPIDFLRLDEHRDAVGADTDPESFRLPPGSRAADPTSYESRLLGAPLPACPDRTRDANPVRYVTSHAPPFLILHGATDAAIPPQQSELLYDALASAGNDATFCAVAGLGHGFLDRPHLDDEGPRDVTVKRVAGGGLEQRTRGRALIFPMIERFFQEKLVSSSAAI